MDMFKPLYQDPFSPVLFSSPPLNVTVEQNNAIKNLLKIVCSDSQFADKTYRSLVKILTGGSVVSPIVTSLVPNTAELGSPSFTIHVHGTGFTPESIIVFAGQEEPTTFVSDKEVTTGVNMDVWLGPDALPVCVLSKEGVLSAPQTFTFVAPESSTLSSDIKKTMNAPAHPSAFPPSNLPITSHDVVKSDVVKEVKSEKK
jgi:hypothetical protein